MKQDEPPKARLNSPLEISFPHDLAGVAHWPEACVCCLARTDDRISVPTFLDTSPEMIPYCALCQNHEPEEIRLSQWDVRKKTDGHKACRIRYTRERVPFSGRYIRIIHVKFHRAIRFYPFGTPRFAIYNVEYAKRFVDQNRLDWFEVIKLNTIDVPAVRGATPIHDLSIRAGLLVATPIILYWIFRAFEWLVSH